MVSRSRAVSARETRDNGRNSLRFVGDFRQNGAHRSRKSHLESGLSDRRTHERAIGSRSDCRRPGQPCGLIQPTSRPNRFERTDRYGEKAALLEPRDASTLHTRPRDMSRTWQQSPHACRRPSATTLRHPHGQRVESRLPTQRSGPENQGRLPASRPRTAGCSRQ